MAHLGGQLKSIPELSINYSNASMQMPVVRLTMQTSRPLSTLRTKDTH